MDICPGLYEQRGGWIFCGNRKDLKSWARSCIAISISCGNCRGDRGHDESAPVTTLGYKDRSTTPHRYLRFILHLPLLASPCHAAAQRRRPRCRDAITGDSAHRRPGKTTSTSASVDHSAWPPVSFSVTSDGIDLGLDLGSSSSCSSLFLVFFSKFGMYAAVDLAWVDSS